MKKLFLFPRKFRVIGLIVLIPAIALYIATDHYDFSLCFLKFHVDSGGDPLFGQADFTNDLAYFLILTGLCFVAFSKQKIEDEMTLQIRLQSFQLSVYLSLIILVFLDLFAFGLDYIFYSTLLWYIFLVLFITIYYTKIYLLTKSATNEK